MVDLPKKRNFSQGFGLAMDGVVALMAIVSIILIQMYAPGGLLSKSAKSAKPETLTLQAAQQLEQQEAARLQLLKKLPTLGFDHLIADWTFLNFLQYFGDEPARNLIGYQLNDDYFDVITQSDPRWVDIYLFLSTSVSFYQAKPETAIALMSRGTDALSPEISAKAWTVWRYKGIDQLLLLGDIPGSIQSHLMAAQWVKGTPSANLAPLFQGVADSLQNNPRSQFVRIQTWLSVYSQVPDKIVRQRAKTELQKLGVKFETDAQGQERFIIPEDLN